METEKVTDDLVFKPTSTQLMVQGDFSANLNRGSFKIST
jgi:hypothetical protein